MRRRVHADEMTDALTILRGLVPPTDEETEPAAIAAKHQRLVRRYFDRFPTATVEQASRALVLPVWSIERARAALAGLPVPYRVKGPPTNTGSVPNWPKKVSRATVDRRRGRAKG